MNEPHAYDLNWREIEYRVQYTRGSKVTPIAVRLANIPTPDLIEYDRKAAGVSRAEAGGAVTVETDQSALDAALFDRHFIAAAGLSGDREAVLAKLPIAVKSSVIRFGVGAVAAKTQAAEEASLDDLLAGDLTVTLEATANGLLFQMNHLFREPQPNDELEFRRATAGAIRTLPGGRKREFMVVQQLDVYPRLYDRLIQSVEGYCADGGPMPSDRAAWVSKIPYYHKKVAVQQLFGSAELEEGGEFFRSGLRPDGAGPGA